MMLLKASKSDFSKNDVHFRGTLLVLVLASLLQTECYKLTKRENPPPPIPSRRDRVHTDKYRTAYGCEGKTLQLNCEKEQSLHLVRANYGRLSLSICNEGGYTDLKVNCMSYRSYLVMQGRCRGKSSCNVTVTSELLGDPCQGTPKYLEVQFYCEDKGSSTTRKPPSLPEDFGRPEIPHHHHSTHSHHHGTMSVSNSDTGDEGVKVAFDNIMEPNQEATIKEDATKSATSNSNDNLNKQSSDGKDVKLSDPSYNENGHGLDISGGQKAMSSSPSYSFAFNISSPRAPSLPSSASSSASSSFIHLPPPNQLPMERQDGGSNSYAPTDSIRTNEANYYAGRSTVESMLSSTNQPPMGGDFDSHSNEPSSSGEDMVERLLPAPHDTLAVSSGQSNSDNFYSYSSSYSAIIISSLMVIILIIIIILWLWRLHRGQLFTSMIIKETVLHWNCPQDKVNPSTVPDHQYIPANDTDNGNLYASKKTTGPILVNPIRDCTGLVENPLNDMYISCNSSQTVSSPIITEYHTNHTSQLNRLNQVDKSRSPYNASSNFASNNATTDCSSSNYLITDGPLTRINVFSGHSRANISHYMDHIYESIENEGRARNYYLRDTSRPR